MGDSVMTEILTRKMNGQLPDYFKDFFQSITFTNGGMRLRLANLRLGQQLYTLPYIKDLFHVVSSHLPSTFRDQVTVRGLESIWSPTYEDQAQKYNDIDDIITLIRLNGGSAVLFKTISYLDDRRRFEDRWYSALRRLDIPCMLFWGDSGAVAPMEIPKFIASKVIPSSVFTGKVLKGSGHFTMLEKPTEWAAIIADFVTKL